MIFRHFYLFNHVIKSLKWYVILVDLLNNLVSNDPGWKSKTKLSRHYPEFPIVKGSLQLRRPGPVVKLLVT